MDNWIGYSPASGHGNGQITITAQTLSGLQERVTAIIATNDEYSLSASANIVQVPSYTSEYLTFNIIEPGNVTFCNTTTSCTHNFQIEYSLNGGEWNTITSYPNSTISVTSGDIIKFRGDNETYYDYTYDNGSATFGKSTAVYDVYGNIMSLIHSSGFATATTINSGRTFMYLFQNSWVRSAEQLELPATSLETSCYWGMFMGSHLSTAPELPATTLAPWCYAEMFKDCMGLRTAPELPATTLADSCYHSMFAGCGYLSTAPELPATALTHQCYNQMFWGCSWLEEAPELPATILDSACYWGMFAYCTSLVSSTELPATTLEESCYQRMFEGCSLLTTAPVLSATTMVKSCYNAMFKKCTGLTTAPVLPSITMAQQCYESMFEGCTSLRTAPVLPATALTNYCYRYMFSGCTILNNIESLAVDGINTNYSTTDWVKGVSSSGTFTKNNSASWPRSSSGIPSNWTVVDAT